VNNEIDIFFQCNDCIEVSAIEDAEEATEASITEVYIYKLEYKLSHLYNPFKMKKGISKNKILFQSKSKRVLKLLSSYIEITCGKKENVLHCIVIFLFLLFLCTMCLKYIQGIIFFVYNQCTSYSLQTLRAMLVTLDVTHN